MTRLHIPVALRWSDLDAYQHVSNVEVFRLLEEARITAFWQAPEGQGLEVWPTAILGSGPEATSQTFVARQEVEYLRPLGFTRVPVRVELWIGRMGSASLDIYYEIYDGVAEFERIGPASSEEPYVRASSTLVLVDAKTGSPQRIGETERGVWEAFVEEPIAFRRR